MALLAEPRRKQKFGPDPRNTYWSNDENKFGHRMLEKMGWKKGKGLGANEDGRTQNVSTVYKDKADVRGVGCSKKHADTWIAHQDDFNALLQALNQEQANESKAGDGSSSKPSVLSLEAKSKSSRSRVHYHKWTRGKDLSSKSAHDLNCIFGKRSTQSCQNTPDQSGGSSDEEKLQQSMLSFSDSASNTVQASELGRAGQSCHGVVTVTSSSSIQEYFAQKMAGLSKQKGAGAGFSRVASDGQSKRTEDASKQADGTSDHTDDNNENTDISASLPKKKKKKKHKQNEADEKSSDRNHCVDETISSKVQVTELPTELIADMSIEQMGSQTDTRKTKKKKEKKIKKEVDDAEETAETSDSKSETAISAVQNCETLVNSECRSELLCFVNGLKAKKTKKHSKKAKETVADAGRRKHKKRVRFSLEGGEVVRPGSNAVVDVNKQDLDRDINRKENDGLKKGDRESEITSVEHPVSESLVQRTIGDSIASESISKKRKKKEKKEKMSKKRKEDCEPVEGVGKTDSTDTIINTTVNVPSQNVLPSTTKDSSLNKGTVNRKKRKKEGKKKGPLPSSEHFLGSNLGCIQGYGSR